MNLNIYFFKLFFLRFRAFCALTLKQKTPTVSNLITRIELISPSFTDISVKSRFLRNRKMVIHIYAKSLSKQKLAKQAS